MANRQQITQSEHDSVIRTACENLDRVNYRIYSNPNQEKNTSINGHYPDIIITTINDDSVKFLIEVETADSINNSESKQWKIYSHLDGTFYLLVPHACLRQTVLLCRQNNITARFGTYRLQNGIYTVTYD